MFIILSMIQEAIEAEFNKRLRKERERLGFSQAEAALALGVSLSTQGAYEAGTRVPDYTYLARLSRVEGVDTMYVLAGVGDGKTDSGSFNWELHDQILEAIEEYEMAEGVVVPGRKKREALRFLYAQFLPQGQFNKEITRSLIKMVA